MKGEKGICPPDITSEIQHTDLPQNSAEPSSASMTTLVSSSAHYVFRNNADSISDMVLEDVTELYVGSLEVPSLTLTCVPVINL